MFLPAALARSFLALAVQEAPAPAAQEPAKPPAQILVLEGATVHTMIPGETPRVATVIVEGERIRSVGLGTEIPPGAARVDLSGKHLIPGLIDGMVNHDPDHDRLYVTSGVTLVRDVGNDLARILTERDKGGQSGARNRGPGPAIWCAGAVLDGEKPATTSAVVIGSVEEAESKLSRLLELEPDFLSFHAGLAAPVLRRVIEIAHGKGLQVWGPKLAALDLAAATLPGQDGFYHLEAFLPPGKTWADVTVEDLRPRVEAVSGKPIAVTPTLAVFAQRLIVPTERPSELDYLGPIYLTSWLADVALREKVISEEEGYLTAGLRVVETQGKLVRALHEKGVKLVPGSASPNPWLLPGEALVDELSLLVRAGIPARSVLELSTSRSARAIGADADRGTIEAGKIADLVALRGDPTADIAALHAPETVVLRGHVLTRGFMDALRADLAARQKALQSAAYRPLALVDPPPAAGEVLLQGEVETRAMGQRISGERYAVVRAEGGSLVYCARLLTPGTASTPDTEVEMKETVRDGDLADFEVKVRTGARVVEYRGISAGSVLNVERRIDGAFQGNVPVRERLAFVDLGSITSAIALGQRTSEGQLRVLFLDDLQPAIGNWELRLDEDRTHLVKTHDGALKVRFAADGAVEVMQREQGSGVATTKTLSSQAKDGGLPAREKRRG